MDTSSDALCLVCILPYTVLKNILIHLSYKDISKTRLVCKHFNDVCIDVLADFLCNLSRKFNFSVPRGTEHMDSSHAIRMDLANAICIDSPEDIPFKIYVWFVRTCRIILASCERQVRANNWYFPHWHILQNIETITDMLMTEEKTNIIGLVRECSRLVVSLNNTVFPFYDNLTYNDLRRCHVKFYGLELVEILIEAVESVVRLQVTHDPKYPNGSCFIIGTIKLRYLECWNHFPDSWTQANTTSFLRQVIDISNWFILFNNDFPTENRNKRFLEYCDLEQHTLGRYLQDIYVINGLSLNEDESFSAEEECPPHELDCEFRLLCPKSVKPLGLQFFEVSETPIEDADMDGNENDEANYDTKYKDEQFFRQKNFIESRWEEITNLLLHSLDDKQIQLSPLESAAGEVINKCYSNILDQNLEFMLQRECYQFSMTMKYAGETVNTIKHICYDMNAKHKIWYFETGGKSVI